MNKKLYIRTYGCQMNERDSEIAEQLLALEGYGPTDDPDEADVILINTCSIREKAAQKVYSLLGQLRTAKANKPSLLIGVAGCVAQQDGEQMASRMPHVDLIVGTQQIHRLPEMLDRLRRRETSREIATDLDASFTIPAFQNPTGVSMSMERRRRLLELADRYDLPIVEDDPYGELVFEGEPMPPLAALDCQIYGALTHVIYLSTFSKLISPGLRVAWVTAPKDVIARMAFAKQGMDLHASCLSQVIVHEVCADGLLERHLPVIRATYRARRDAMLAALAEKMPDEFRWTKPRGGMFVWMTMPEGWDAEGVIKIALDKLVAFVPGFPFYANGGPRNTARLSFANPTPANIDVAIGRVAEAVRAYRP